jgi:hypothetical protein
LSLDIRYAYFLNRDRVKSVCTKSLLCWASQRDGVANLFPGEASISKDNLMMAPMKRKDASSASEVEGRVRCHKCLLICSDAAHYFSHKCETPSLSLATARGVTAQETSSELRSQSVRRDISA